MTRSKPPEIRPTTCATHLTGITTPQEQLFVNALSVTNDEKTALVESGLATKGISHKKAKEHVTELLQNPNIYQALQNSIKDRVKRLQATEDKVIAQLMRMAEFDPGVLQNEKGSSKKLHELPVHARQCITGVKFKNVWGGKGKRRRVRGCVVEYKTINQLDAIKLLLEKVIFKQTSVNFNQFNISNTTENKTINIDALSKKQVDALLSIVRPENEQENLQELIEIEQSRITEIPQKELEVENAS